MLSFLPRQEGFQNHIRDFNGSHLLWDKTYILWTCSLFGSLRAGGTRVRPRKFRHKKYSFPSDFPRLVLGTGHKNDFRESTNNKIMTAWSLYNLYNKHAMSIVGVYKRVMAVLLNEPRQWSYFRHAAYFLWQNLIY